MPWPLPPQLHPHCKYWFFCQTFTLYVCSHIIKTTWLNFTKCSNLCMSTVALARYSSKYSCGLHTRGEVCYLRLPCYYCPPVPCHLPPAAPLTLESWRRPWTSQSLIQASVTSRHRHSEFSLNAPVLTSMCIAHRWSLCKLTSHHETRSTVIGLTWLIASTQCRIAVTTVCMKLFQNIILTELYRALTNHQSSPVHVGLVCLLWRLLIYLWSTYDGRRALSLTVWTSYLEQSIAECLGDCILSLDVLKRYLKTYFVRVY